MYALIENAKVTNIVSADKRGADSLISAGLNLIQTDKPVAIGMITLTGNFIVMVQKSLHHLRKLF